MENNIEDINIENNKYEILNSNNNSNISIWNYVSNKLHQIQNENIENFIFDFVKTKKSLNTQKAYIKDLNDFFIQHCNIKILSQLIAKTMTFEISDIASDYINSIKKRDPQDYNRVLNPRTVNRKLFAISAFFEYLNKKYNFKYNPVKILEPLKTPKHSSTTGLEKIEVDTILNYLKDKYFISKSTVHKLTNLRNYLIFIFLTFSLRRNEVSKLRWKDIRESNWKKYIEVLQKWWDIKYIPISNNVYQYMMEYKQQKENLWFYSDYIFTPIKNNSTKKYDTPITSNYIYYLVIYIWGKVYNHKDIEHVQNTINNYILEKKKYQQKIHRTSNVKEIYLYQNQIDKIKNNINELRWQIKKLNEFKKHITPHSFRKHFIERALKNKEKINLIDLINTTWHSASSWAQMIAYYQNLDKVENNALNHLDFNF